MADNAFTEAEEQTKEEVARITSHSKSDLKPYTGVDSDYMNYSSVARKPFEPDVKSDEKETAPEQPKAPAGPATPKASGNDNK